MTTRHILIVEDEPQFALVLSETLECSDQGYSANVVHSGEEALQKIDEKRDCKTHYQNLKIRDW